MAVRSKVLNVRTTEDEYNEIKNFAAFQGLSVTDFVIESVLERIEDWNDVQAVREYEKEKAEGHVGSISWEQVQAELDLS